MQPRIYSIDDFRWVEQANTFYAKMNSLFTYYKNELVSFAMVTGKRRFYIENPRTGNRRRFTFKHEYFDLMDRLIYVFEHKNSKENFEIEIRL